MSEYTNDFQRELRARRKRGGKTTLVPVKHMQRILLDWNNWGFSETSIASALQVPKGTVGNIINGRTSMMTHQLHGVIARLDYQKIFETAPDSALVAAYASIRKIHALNRMGWSNEELGERLRSIGGSASLPEDLSRSSSPSITARTHRLIDELYRGLHMTPGISSSSSTRALKKGYAPPFAWDDINSYHDRPKGIRNDNL